MKLHQYFIWADLFGKRSGQGELISKTLRENVLFCTLSTPEIAYLSKVVHLRHYDTGEVIFEQFARGAGMYVIASGSVAIKAEAGKHGTFVTRLHRGNFFGELSLVERDNCRSASAVASEKTVLLGFFKPDLMEILERRPSMGVKILSQVAMVLGRRLIETTEQLTRASMGKDAA